MQLYDDMRDSLQAWPIWLHSAWIESLLRFRHSVLGVVWVTMPLLIVIAMKSFLFSGVLNVSAERYIPSLAFGMVFWRLMSGQILSGSVALTSNRGLLKQRHYPFFVFILKNVVKNLFEFMFSFLTIAVVVLFYHNFFEAKALLVIPAALILQSILIFAGYSLSVFSCRFPDLQSSLGSFIRVIFLLTPIIWLPEMAGGKRSLFLQFNPFYHLLEMIRDPLLGQPIDPLNWIVSGGILLFVIAVAALSAQSFKRQPIIWI